MILTISRIYNVEQWDSQYGPMMTTYFSAADDHGNEAYWCINHSPKYPQQEGGTIDCAPTGKDRQEHGVTWTGVKRNQAGKGGGGGRIFSGGGGSAPQRSAAPPLGLREAVTLMQQVNKALGVEATPEQATSLFLGCLRGEIERPAAPTPTPQAQPLPAPPAPPPGYAPAAPQPRLPQAPPTGGAGDDNIPF